MGRHITTKRCSYPLMLRYHLENVRDLRKEWVTHFCSTLLLQKYQCRLILLTRAKIVNPLCYEVSAIFFCAPSRMSTPDWRWGEIGVPFTSNIRTCLLIRLGQLASAPSINHQVKVKNDRAIIVGLTWVRCPDQSKLASQTSGFPPRARVRLFCSIHA
jgi:hypothetical protein